MISEDIKSYEEDMKGVNCVLYIIGLFIVVCISILKEVCTLVYDLRCDRRYNMYHFTPKGSRFRSAHEIANSYLRERNGFLDSLDEYALTPKFEERERPTEDALKEERTKIYKYSKALRNYLLENDYTLTGCVLKEKNPKVSLEDLVYSDDRKAYIIQHITFGNEINDAISYLFNVEKCKKRGLLETYLVFENGNTIELEEKMKYYFMDRGLKITLIDKTKNVR